MLEQTGLSQCGYHDNYHQIETTLFSLNKAFTKYLVTRNIKIKIKIIINNIHKISTTKRKAASRA